jgi:hypothetical protein
MTAILAVMINLSIMSTDGVFEGKKRQGVRTTEPHQHSARQQHALGVVLVPPVLNLVSYRRMSASDTKRQRTLARVSVAFACWYDFNLPILH